MDSFQLTRAQSPQDAIRAGAMSSTAQQGADVRFLAGGTTLVDLMKLRVERPRHVIDISGLELGDIETLEDGGVRIGAMVRNANLAHHEFIQRHYPVLSQALLSGASAQLRNMATTGGNLLQRTRCVYFRDTAMPCNKREPGTGCSAIGGYNRNLAILGTSEHCIASNASDMNVALAALDATVHVQGSAGERSIPIREFHALPGDTPHIETVLQPGDLITHVSLPAPVQGARSTYLKLRDRASYEFALASAAVVARVVDNRIEFVSIALGGVGTRPWHAGEAVALLQGQAPDADRFSAAADAVLAGAVPQSENGFKIELARRCLVHALSTVTLPERQA